MHCNLRLLSTVVTLSLIGHVEASEHFRVSGFGNVNLIKSGTENLGYIYDLSKKSIFDEWDLKTGSAFGLQLNAKINDSFSIVLQGVFQDKIENDLNKSVTWAFVRYNANPHLSFRAGRIATPIYMLSEYRDVGFAYLWTQPISGFYSSIPVTYIDGGDVSYHVPLGEGIFETRLFGGRSELALETIYNAAEITLSPLFGVKLTYSIDNWFFSGVASTTKVKKGEPASTFISYLTRSPSTSAIWPRATSIASDFKIEDSRISYFSLGGHYESGQWNIQSELSYTQSNWAFFPDLASGYISLGRQFNQSTLYTFVSKTKSVGDTYNLSPPSTLTIPAVSMLYNLIDSSLNSQVIDQESLGFGVRFDVLSNIALKGQIERTWLNNNHIGGWFATLPALSAQAPDHIDTFSLSLSFVF